MAEGRIERSISNKSTIFSHYAEIFTIQGRGEPIICIILVYEG